MRARVPSLIRLTKAKHGRKGTISTNTISGKLHVITSVTTKGQRASERRQMFEAWCHSSSQRLCAKVRQAPHCLCHAWSPLITARKTCTRTRPCRVFDSLFLRVCSGGWESLHALITCSVFADLQRSSRPCWWMCTSSSYLPLKPLNPVCAQKHVSQ